MEHRGELKGWSIGFLGLLWFLWFINIGARAVFSPILPLVEDEFLVTHAQASGLFVFQSIGYGCSLFLSGIYAGRIGYKRCIAFSLALSSAVFFLIPFVRSFSTLYVISFILGFSIGAYLPSALPLITDYFAEKHWGKSISIHDTGASVSIFSIPFIVLFLLHLFQWRGIFLVLAIVFLLAAAVFTLTVREVKVTHPTTTFRGGLLTRRTLWIIGLVWIFAAGANWGVYFTIPLYLTKELSLGIGFANTVLGISRLGGIIVAVACGVLVDKFSLKKITFVMVLFTGILTVLVGAVSARLIGICLFFQVIFVTGFFPLGLVSIAKTFGREERGMATGVILTLSVLLGSGLLPYLLGLSGDLVSFRVGIILLGACVTLSSLLLFTVEELK